MLMSAGLPEKGYQPPMSGAWSSRRGDQMVYPQPGVTYPKKEIFEDVDLANLPLSMLSQDGIGNMGPSPTSIDFTTSIYDDQPCGLLESPSFHSTQRSTAAMTQPPTRMGGPVTPICDYGAEDSCLTPEAKRSPSSRYNGKRKSTSSAAGSSSRSSTSPPPSVLQPRKTTHNMIEKRYRTNLNDKIAALRDAVPSLRVMVHRLSRDGEGFDEADLAAEAESLGGLAPAHKLNKATVLSKATEYIAHLERSNAALISENSHLRNRVAGLEMMVVGRGPAYGGSWG